MLGLKGSRYISGEGKEYVRKNFKCTATLIRPNNFLRLSIRVFLNFKNPYNF